jgi:hypothetical protein
MIRPAAVISRLLVASSGTAATHLVDTTVLLQVAIVDAARCLGVSKWPAKQQTRRALPAKESFLDLVVMAAADRALYLV